MTKKINQRNNHIALELYSFYLHLKKELGARIVHRRRRASNTCIEIVFSTTLIKQLTGRLNTLTEAEACGYWIMCRRQTKRGHSIYRNQAVYQLFLTPVHPKKRNEAKHLAAQTSQDVSFEPIVAMKNPKIQRLHIRTAIKVAPFLHVKPVCESDPFAILVKYTPPPAKKLQINLHNSKKSSKFASNLA